ncbi:hypothetical protein V7S43_004893 [Phytophthora oleae]|uniref:Uncharacterized protein n=1 Tax=Phytophthora oleae TaxID=2107226 RepID=A0ABD3FVV5_9STRA
MQEAANADMTKLLVFFRQEADYRANADAVERREAAEKRNRDQRQRDRQVEQAALVLTMLEDDRIRREEEASKELAVR